MLLSIIRSVTDWCVMFCDRQLLGQVQSIKMRDGHTDNCQFRLNTNTTIMGNRGRYKLETFTLYDTDLLCYNYIKDESKI